MWRIYGQEHITRQLDAAIRAGRVSHAYLLVGPPHVGKMALAVGMAQGVNCLAGGRTAIRPGTPSPDISPEPELTTNLFGFGDAFGFVDAPPEAADNDLPGLVEPALDTEDPGPTEEIEHAGGPGPAEEPEPAGGPGPTGDVPGGPGGTGVAGVPCGECGQCQRISQGVHPDIRVIGLGTGDDEGTNRRDIRIEQVREIESFLNLTPYEGACKVIIVDGAELMNTAASNALLKTLEEPPPHSLLLLLTANEDALLPTIRSRCSALYLKPAAKADLEERLTREYEADPEVAERVARISRGCFGQAVNAVQDSQVLEQRDADLARLQEVCEGGLDVRFDYAAELATRFGRDRDAAREMLYLWLRWWRDLLLIKEGAEEYLQNTDRLMPLRLQATQLSTGQVVACIKRINRTLEALDANANPRLALEALMMGVPRVRV